MFRTIRRKIKNRQNNNNAKKNPDETVPVAGGGGGSGDVVESSSSFLLALAFELRIVVLSFLDQPSFVNASETSKELRRDCRREQIEKKIVPVYEICSKRRRTRMITLPPQPVTALIRKLCRNQIKKSEKFSRYRRLRVHRICDFYGNGIESLSVNTSNADSSSSIRKLWGVLYLDASLSAQRGVDRYVVADLLYLLPNLRQVDLSNVILTGIAGNGPIAMFRDKPWLEKVAWNRTSNVTVEGSEFRNCKNLKEVCMDDTKFVSCWIYRGRLRHLSDLSSPLRRRRRWNDNNNYNDEEEHNDNGEMGSVEDYVFCYLQSIERLSVRNARWREPGSRPGTETPVSQDALIKFVRNALPALRWFRSDLTKQNADALRKERPEIEFLN